MLTWKFGDSIIVDRNCDIVFFYRWRDVNEVVVVVIIIVIHDWWRVKHEIIIVINLVIVIIVIAFASTLATR